MSRMTRLYSMTLKCMHRHSEENFSCPTSRFASLASGLPLFSFHSRALPYPSAVNVEQKKNRIKKLEMVFFSLQSFVAIYGYFFPNASA